MDILEQNFGESPEEFSLENVVDVNDGLVKPPQGSIRNRAATTAILSSDPEKAVADYQMMVNEAEQGTDSTFSQRNMQIQGTTQEIDMQTVMQIMGDKTIPIEKKRAAIQSIQQSQFLKDSGSILHTRSLSAASRDESFEAEESRLTTADMVKDIYDAREKIQGLVNAHGATLESASVETVADMTGLYVLPFGNSVSKGKVGVGVSEGMGEKIGTWDKIKSYLLPGSTTLGLRERLTSIPPEKRVEFAKTVLDSITSNSGIIMSNDNQFAQFDAARSIFENGGYSSTEAFLDNVSPLLDVIGVGQAMRGVTRAGKAIKGTSTAENLKPEFGQAKNAGDAGEYVHPVNNWEVVGEMYNPNQFPSTAKHLSYEEDLADQVKRIELNTITRIENPASPAKIMQQANPEKARAVHEIVVKADSDQIAEGLYGTSQMDAIISDVFPQVATKTDAVTSKIVDIQRNLRQEGQANILDAVQNSGAIYYTKAEKARARAMKMNDFAQAEGMTINDSMSSFKLDGGQVVINAVYSGPEGSFLRAEDAFEQAKLALRNYGIKDEEIEILRKEGLDHVPVKLSDVYGVDGNYLVKIATRSEINPDDVGLFDSLDVKKNWFDRVGATVSKDTGSVSRWLMDASSMLHPTIVGSASVASDATSRFHKVLLDVASKFSDSHQKLPKSRQAKIDDYIREANFNGIPFDSTNLIARGFQPKEIDTIKAWRDFWDAHFYLENYDVVRTLNAEGYKLFKNQNTELYARPIAKNSTVGAVYDPVSDSVRYVTQAELDDLYAKGGSYAKLRRPVDFAGKTTEYMMVRNTPTEYLRGFRDSDQVLNYRDGYFQIQYNAPKFVEEVTRDVNGAITGRRAVAVAGDTKEASHFASRLARSNGLEYQVRGDIRALRKDDDAYWDVNSASGRIAQRHRGKLLEDGSGLNHLGDGSYIMNPVDSALRAAQSISGRTVTRPMLEASKARAIQQYGEMFPPDGMGGRRWPSSVKEIEDRGNPTSSRVADARTTYEYIKYLENGYINSADDVFKATFHAIAAMAGKGGFPTAERALTGVSEIRPTSVIKNGVFMSYIGTNFIRQWIIQPHQVVRTFAYNPVGWTNGGIEKLVTTYVGQLAGVLANPSIESKAFKKFVDDSGLLDAVDKNNLIRGSLTEAADSSYKAARLVGKAVAIPRKIGFDIGEQANLLGHAAAVYERYKRGGKNLTDKTVRDEAYSEIRALSYDMNFAGDMPYNQTTPAMLLQFMQVPHKALLQLTNRRLDVKSRMRLAAGDLIMWGPPTLLIGDLMGADILPDNPEQRELFTYGVESWALNRVLTEMAGERVNVDFSSLAPYELTGWGEFFKAMYSGGVEQAIMNSPGGQLFMKEGGRTQQAIQAMGRYFGAFDEVGQDKTDFKAMMNEVAKISSGWNNWQKAQLMLNTRKRLDQYGSVTDEDVQEFEAWAQVLGFGSADTRELYKISKQMSGDVKAHKEDVLRVYQDIKRYYTNKLEVEVADPKFITAVTGFILKTYENDPEAQKIIQNQLSFDMQGKEAGMIGLFMKRSGLEDLGGLRDQVNRMPVSDEQKALMMQRIEDMEKTRKQMTKEEDK